MLTRISEREMCEQMPFMICNCEIGYIVVDYKVSLLFFDEDQ